MNHKKYIWVCLLAILSCSQKELDQRAISDEGGVKTFNCFSASIDEDALTKLHKEGLNFSWEEGDGIGIYSDLHEPVIYYKEADGKFRGEEISGHVFYAFYPTYGVLSYNKDNPSVMTVSSRPATFSNIQMVAKSDDNSLSFKQIYGLLKFSFTGENNVRSILHCMGSPCIPSSGFSVDLSQDVPRVSWDESNCVSGTEFLQGEVLEKDGRTVREHYVFLPEMSLPDGFDLEIISEDPLTGHSAKMYQKTYKSVNISRATLLSFPNIDLSDLDNDIECHDQIIAEERAALVELYNSLNGEGWFNKENWCSDKPVSTWYGIMTDDSGRVFSINLNDNNLDGTIPESIDKFKMLSHLGLRNNDTCNGRVRGEIPATIGNLKYLSTLDLENHRLSGYIPETMADLEYLLECDLSGDWYEDNGHSVSLGDLHGSFPFWIGDGEHCLGRLDIGCNKFDGAITDEMLSKVKHLSVLTLESNNFSGSIPNLTRMERLNHVNFSNNYFTGTIPASFAEMMSNGIEKAYFGFNQLTGLSDDIYNHPLFSEYATMLLLKQREGYHIEIKDNKVPACRHIFETLDGGVLDLGTQYGEADYTLIVRWAEWCQYSNKLIPHAIELAEKYEEAGLQTIWAYAGGDDAERDTYMKKVGLDTRGPHIIECHDTTIWDSSIDHAIWLLDGGFYTTPFVEVVNKDGNIVFIEDHNGIEERSYDYPFSYRREDIDMFLAEKFGDEIYISTDYSADGNVHALQTASKGQGVNVVLMGDFFSDRLIADGTYEDVMEKAAEALFSEEPYKSYKDFFNVYYIDVVSKHEVYFGEGALDTWYGNGTEVGGNDNKVFEYAGRVLSADQLYEALLIVMMNRDYYAGTCYMYYPNSGDYGSGASVSYFPTSSDIATFNGLVSHEAGGHGFAKLADEYAYEYKGAMPEDEKQQINVKVPFGWFKNADFTGDPLEVKWAQFIADNRYDDENIGCYEGAFTYWTGAWRPTDASIMRYNTGGFNAPSRYAIWYRIHKLAYGDEWQGTYEDFVEYDKVNRTPAAVARRKQQRRNFVEKDFEPLAPPVIINQDWRDSLRSRP